MALPTRKVTCVLRDQFGNPASGARVTFLLTRPDIHPATGVIAPEQLEGVTDANGELEVDVFPNALGITGSQYRVRAWNPDNGRKFVDSFVTVPDQDCFLQDILDTEAPEAIGPAQAAAISAQASAVLARAWASKTDGAVADGEFSAKHWAQQAAAEAGSIGTAVEDAIAAAATADAARVAAQASAVAADSSADAAAASQVAASGSASAASGSATTASGHATAAQTARTGAENARDTAQGHATAAGTARTGAETAATNASNSATAASGSATAASGSATAASGSASAAAGSASTASGHATTAQGHATAAGNSATSAAASAVAADASADDAEAALLEFSRLYLGAKTADPTVDNEGNPLLQGAWYFRTISPTIRVWTGSAWINAPQGPPGEIEDLGGVAMLAENNTFAELNQFDKIAYLKGGLRMSANAREFSTSLSGAVAASTVARIGEFTFGANGQALMITGVVGMQTADSYGLNSFVLVAKAGTLPTKELKLYKDGDLTTLPLDVLLYENEATGRVVLAVDVGDGGQGLHWSFSVVEADAYNIFTPVTAMSALVTTGLTEVPAVEDVVAEIAGGMRFHGPVEFLDTVTGLTKAMVGLGAVDNTSDADKPLSTAATAALALKANLASPDFSGNPTAPTQAAGDNSTRIANTAWVKSLGFLTSAPVTSVAGKTGAVSLVKGDVGLGNVDNTADTAKPVSTAQQTALNLKANLASPTFTGTVGGITKSMVGLGNVDNTADSAKPVSTAQQAALDLKAPLASPAFTGTPTGITKAHVGLGNVDNTADSAKPVSTAQATAIGLKSNTASPTFTGTVTVPTLALSGPARGAVLAVAASAIDAALGNYFTKTAAGNLTWTVTNAPATSSWYFLLRLTNGGAFTMTWPASFKWPGGVAPALTAAGTDLIIGVTDDGGTTFRCNALLDVK